LAVKINSSIAELNLDESGDDKANDREFSVFVPLDMNFYLWQRQRSHLLNCREDIASALKAQNADAYTTSLLPIKAVIEDMAGYRDILYAHRLTFTHSCHYV
jgi:hypothetical protein